MLQQVTVSKQPEFRWNFGLGGRVPVFRRAARWQDEPSAATRLIVHP